jgi:hypothetical protein
VPELTIMSCLPGMISLFVISKTKVSGVPELAEQGFFR